MTRKSESIHFPEEITRNWYPFQVTPCPIANQADSGNELYTEYPQIADVCGFLKCPVIQAGNTDFLVLTSINPHTTKLTTDIVREKSLPRNRYQALCLFNHLPRENPRLPLREAFCL